MAKAKKRIMTLRKFEVSVQRTEWGHIDVVAENEGEAFELASIGYNEGQIKWGKENFEVQEIKEIGV